MSYNSNYRKRRGSYGTSSFNKYVPAKGRKKVFRRRTFVRKTGLGMMGRYSAHKAINPKLKTMDQDWLAYANPFVVDALPGGAITICSTPVVQNLAMIQQGGGESQRLGNKVALKSLRLRLQLVTTGNGAADNNNYARFMIIYDRQTNGVYPAANSILSQLNQSNVTVAGTYLDSINPNYLERYLVLCDEFLTLPTNQIAATINFAPTTDKSYYIDKYIKLKNLEMQFSGNTQTMAGGAGISNVTTGALYLLSWGSVVIGSEPWCWGGNIRIRFHDC